MQNSLRSNKLIEWLKKHHCSVRVSINSYDHAYFNRLENKFYIDPDCDEGLSKSAFSGNIWEISHTLQSVKDNPHAIELIVEAKLGKGQCNHSNIGVELVFSDWKKSVYVLMPAAAYNGNRYPSRRIPYSPKLKDPEDIGVDQPMIVSDIPRLNVEDGPSCIQERSGSMSIPSAGFYDYERNLGFWLLTPQGNRFGDFGYTIRENRQRNEAVISVFSPVVREYYKYKLTDSQVPSDDQGAAFREGDVVHIPLRLYFFESSDLNAFYSYHSRIREDFENDREDRLFVPFSSVFPIQEEKFNNQNFVEPQGYYAVGMRENFLQDWQIGWTGGMISTYPLLFNGNQETCNRVIRNFNWLFPDGVAPSGFFYDCAQTTGKGTEWYGGDIRKPHAKNWHLVRKSGDGLYYILKQFRLMHLKKIETNPVWEERTRGVADAFTDLWKKYGQFGQFVDSHTGEIQVGGSASGAIVPAALVYASDYFDRPEYLKVAARAAESFYNNYVSKGITNGGVGDALQCPDSESAYALLESFMVLYEYTREKRWLRMAEKTAVQFSSWICGYNYLFPEDSLLGRLDIKTKGSVFANVQNKHGSPGICTHSGVALFRLFRATRDIFYIRLLRDIIRFIPQMMSHPSRPIKGMDIGWITERVNTTDWLEGIGEIMYGSTWSETSLMLAYTEIPGLYVQPDESFVFPFDFVDYEILHDDEKELVLRVINPSEERIRLRVFSENSEDLGSPFGENTLFGKTAESIEPGGSVRISFQKY